MQTAVGFPLKYLQKKGPNIHLIDNKTKKDTWLRVSLASHSLLEDFLMIEPEKTEILRWVIHQSELEQFNRTNPGAPLDLSAEFSLSGKMKMDSSVTEFKITDVLKIIRPE